MLKIEYWMLSKNAALDRGGDRSRYDHSGQHCLIEVADNFFQRESHGGDRRVECRRDTCGHSDRSHSSLTLARQIRNPTQEVRYPRTNLNCRTLASQRGSTSYLQDSQYKFAERVAKGHTPRM